MADDDVYTRRVSLGAKFLDEESPGWYTKINLDELDMSEGKYYPESHCGCIGAQLDFYETGIGEYSIFIKEMGLATFNSMVHLGFSLDNPDLANMDLWDKLTGLWKKEINGRLAESA